MYEYDTEILAQLQRTEFEMLQHFDTLCKKYDIPYFALFGTAIGAIRHKGFIPWDDDIDVGMMRSDYEKLRNIPNYEWKEFELSDPLDNYPAHTLIYPQIYKKGTAFVTKYHSTYDEFSESSANNVLPIWLDIFLFDHVSSVEDVKRKYKKTYLYQKLFYYSKSRIKVIKSDPLKKKLMCLIKRFAHDVLSIKKEPAKLIYQNYINLVNNHEGDYVTTYETSVPADIIKSISKYEDMFPVIRVPFESGTICIQKNYEEMLTNIYGDYMKIPPIEQRINHPPAILDFGMGNIMNDET